jgi:hypothetical protein
MQSFIAFSSNVVIGIATEESEFTLKHGRFCAGPGIAISHQRETVEYQRCSSKAQASESATPVCHRASL